MANRTQLRQGTSTPTTSDLLDRELGVDTSAEGLHLRIGSTVHQVQFAIKNNSTTTSPGVNDDESEGYVFASHWYNSSTQKVYFCADNTDGAAVWLQLN